MNLMNASLASGRLCLNEMPIEIAPIPGLKSGAVTIGVRPSHVRLAESGLPGRLLLSENLGESMLLNVDIGDQIVKLRLPGTRRLAEGETVHLAFDAGHIHFFDPKTRRRIAAPGAPGGVPPKIS